MPPESRRIDQTSVALGEMREFMTHHRQQMDKVTDQLSNHSDSLHHLRQDAEKQMALQDRTRKDVGDIKISLAALCDQHQQRKTARTSNIKGFAVGVGAMAVVAAVYYKDSDLLQVLYKHTIGLIL